MGSDWFLQKNHDTFAPLGPFIVPREYVPEPLNLRQTLTNPVVGPESGSGGGVIT